MLNVTDVRVRKIEGRQKLRAVAAITLENCFVVNEIKVIEGTQGLFVAMPSIKTKNGMFRDIAHPINSDMREKVTKAVLNAYETIEVNDEETAQKEAESEEKAEVVK